MTPTAMFVFSAVATLSFVAGFHFFRFWRSSGDRFFLLFGLAFGMMGLHRALLVIWAQTSESQHAVFALRLVGHLILLGAILDKNLRSAGPKAAPRREESPRA